MAVATARTPSAAISSKSSTTSTPRRPYWPTCWVSTASTGAAPSSNDITLPARAASGRAGTTSTSRTAATLKERPEEGHGWIEISSFHRWVRAHGTGDPSHGRGAIIYFYRSVRPVRRAGDQTHYPDRSAHRADDHHQRGHRRIPQSLHRRIR